MAAAAVPAISLGAQYFMNRGQNKQAQGAVNAAQTGLQTSAADLSGFGGKLGAQAGGFLGDAQKGFGQSGQALDQTQNYFSPLLRGGRGAIDQAIAPERAMVGETYKGAQNALDASGARGGVKDMASAELNRDRAGKLALLGPQMRHDAAGSMLQVAGQRGQIAGQQAGVGTALSGQATGAKLGSGQLNTSLFAGANRQQEVGREYNNQSSSAIGGMIFDALKSRGPKAGKAGGAAPAFGLGAPNTGSWGGP